MTKIYLASSWRNKFQPEVLSQLRADGHQVYDFRHPTPGDTGFAWSSIDPAWEGWDPRTFAELLQHPIAQRGFAFDRDALDWCEACVMLLPCGRSAHLEAGYAIGRGKRTIFYLRPENFEPELMYLLGQDFAFDADSLRRALS